MRTVKKAKLPRLHVGYTDREDKNKALETSCPAA